MTTADFFAIQGGCYIGLRRIELKDRRNVKYFFAIREKQKQTEISSFGF